LCPIVLGCFGAFVLSPFWIQDKFVVWFYRTAIFPRSSQWRNNIALQLWPLAQQKSNYALQLSPLARQERKALLISESIDSV